MPVCAALVRIGTLCRDQGHRVVVDLAMDLQGGIESGEAGAHPGDVLRRGAGVHHDAVALGREEIHDQVVDHAAGFVQHAGIQRLARHGQPGHVVGQQAAQVVAGAGSGEVQRAHVGNVEHAGVAPHGVVFLDLRAVMDGHLPTGEIDHLRAGGEVGCVERSA
jgi:hypothetical protein